jgi:PAS domain S-box-containing protein
MDRPQTDVPTSPADSDATRDRAALTLRRAALAVAQLGSVELFGQLVRQLAEDLGASVVFIAIFEGTDRVRMTTLAARMDGKPMRNFSYVLEGTPCAAVVGHAFRYIARGARTEFPAGTIFSAKAMDSYAAYPLGASDGSSLGLIAAMDRAPIADPDLAESLMKIFAVRVSAELERQRGLETLRSREEQYRAIFDGSADALVLWDRTVRIVDVNAAFNRMYGYTPAEVVGRSFGSRFSREEVAKRATLIERALAGEAGHMESRTIRKDGSQLDVELRYLPIMHRGEPHVLAVARDITARRKAEARRLELEDQVRQAQKMEAIGQLTGGIAHDFNNILTSVIGYLAMAEERAADLGDSQLTRQLDQASLAARRARDLIAQMLTFARRQRGARRPTELTALVGQSVQLLRATMPSSTILDADVPDYLPMAEVDGVQVEQVLFNLCINARDAVEASGRIRVGLRETVSASWRCASCRADVPAGRWLELSVADNGSGIDDDVMDRMFDPFFSTKEMGRGSGMGLAMVHGIVHDHGGHLQVTTVPGEGSTFRVMLQPSGGELAAAAPASAGPLAKAVKAPGLRGRVLVVEDQAPVADCMAELLGSWGLEVTVQRDPIDALDWLQDASNLVDLVITDQTMPQMTGVEVAARVAAERPGLPVMLYTGDADEFDPAELRRCGVRKMLRKPIEPKVLRSTLQDLLAADAGR